MVSKDEDMMLGSENFRIKEYGVSRMESGTHGDQAVLVDLGHVQK